MFQVTEQQAIELTQRIGAIREISDATVFAEIEVLVHQASVTGQLTDNEVNRLYELLNCAIIINENAPTDDFAVQGEWDDPSHEVQKNHPEEIKEKDLRNHILLRQSEHLRDVEIIRRCIRNIAKQRKSNGLFQGSRRGVF